MLLWPGKASSTHTVCGTHTPGVIFTDLAMMYLQVILAYGAESHNKLDVPGEVSLESMLAAYQPGVNARLVLRLNRCRYACQCWHVLRPLLLSVMHMSASPKAASGAGSSATHVLMYSISKKGFHSFSLPISKTGLKEAAFLPALLHASSQESQHPLKAQQCDQTYTIPRV